MKTTCSRCFTLVASNADTVTARMRARRGGQEMRPGPPVLASGLRAAELYIVLFHPVLRFRTTLHPFVLPREGYHAETRAAAVPSDHRAMSSFAALRAKAESAASSAKEKSNNFLDKRQSPSSSSTTARPPPSRPPPSSTADSATDRRLPPTASKAPPRPPPRQAEASTAPLPPPRSLPDQTSLPSRTSAPSLPSRDTPPPSYRATAAPQSSTKRLVGDGPAEKQQFFSLLDEYFANRGQHRVQSTSRGPIAPPLKETVAHVEPDEAPSAPTWARRPLSTATSGAGADFTMSHPPACIRSCSAEDACTDFLPEAVWRTEWYTSPAPQPPLMQQRNDIAWAGSMMQRGSEKSVVGMALFADLRCARLPFPIARSST